MKSELFPPKGNLPLPEQTAPASSRPSPLRLLRKFYGALLGMIIALVAINYILILIVPNFRDILTFDDELFFRYKPLSKTKDYHTLLADHRSVSYEIGPFGERVDSPAAAERYHDPYILCLGDSTTFGHGADGNESYPYFLDQLVQPTATALNFGVSGYNTYQTCQYAKKLINEFHPKVAVLQFDYNDDDPVLPIQAPPDRAWPWRSRVGGMFRFLALESPAGRRLNDTTPNARLSFENLMQSMRGQDMGVVLIYETLPKSLQGLPLDELPRRYGLRTIAHEITYYRNPENRLKSSYHLNGRGAKELAGNVNRLIRENFPELFDPDLRLLKAQPDT